MDVVLTKEVLEAARSVQESEPKRQELAEELNKLPHLVGRHVTLRGLGSKLADGSEMRVSKERVRIGSDLKSRVDTQMFSDPERSKVVYDASTINATSPFRKGVTTYRLDHRLKQAIIDDKHPWGHEDVMEYGRIPREVRLDLMKSLSPSRRHAEGEILSNLVDRA